jgi:hypothetical protein
VSGALCLHVGILESGGNVMRLSHLGAIIAAPVLAVVSQIAVAAPTVDGTVDAEYGAPLAVQQVQTGFGDASPPGSLGGSELDAAYAKVSGGRLYIMLSGNHEPNLNKLEIFIDSKAGGENTLTGTPQYDFNDSGTHWISQNMAGLTFDSGFTADYHIFSRWGSGSGSYDVDIVDRQGGANAQVPGNHGSGIAAVGLVSTGTILPTSIGTNNNASALTSPLDFAINDNNAAGVSGGSAAADTAAAAAVTTGMEFSISLADLGNPTGPISIAAMINNGDHNYLSNQILGSLTPPQGNLGGDGSGGFTGTLGGDNFSQLAGLQYFQVAVPEPASIGLMALFGLAAFGRRRSR